MYIVRGMQQLSAEVVDTQNLGNLHASSVERPAERICTDLTFRIPMVNATQEVVVMAKLNLLGERARHPVYRLWSGWHQCDAPALESGRPEELKVLSPNMKTRDLTH